MSARVVTALALALLCGGGRARAHGGRPQTQDVLFGADGRVVVVATFGLLTSDDDGASWAWTCQESIPDAVAGVTWPAALLGTDELLMASPFGLLRGEAAGCGWRSDERFEAHVVADVVQPGDGATTLLVTGDLGAENALHAGVDPALEVVGAPLRAGFVPATVRVAPSDPMRIYVTGRELVGAEVRARVLASEDAGARWVERTLPAIDGHVRVARGLAVDPADPDVHYVVTQEHELDRLFRTPDGGASWELVRRLPSAPGAVARPFALAIDADGAAWFGNTRSGLWVRRPDGALEAIDEGVAVACLVARGATIWMCADGLEDGFALARFDASDPAARTTVLRLEDVERRRCGPALDCRCDPYWDDFLLEVMRSGEIAGPDPSCPRDGGVGDAGTAPAPASCACRAGARTAGATWLASFAGLAALRRARPRPRRRGASGAPRTPARAPRAGP